MKPIAAILTLSLFQCGNQTVHRTADTKATQQIGGPCDGCELLYEGQPVTLGPTLALTSEFEPGEQLVIKGSLVQIDGKTPAENIILYIYHTDANGLYSPGKEQTLGLRHGHLRGWLKTGADGLFTLTTIRPAPYPKSSEPAHIHIFVKEPDKNEYYIDAVRFMDDPKNTMEVMSKADGRGGDLNLPLKKDSEGVWRGDLQITLGKNVPGYW